MSDREGVFEGGFYKIKEALDSHNITKALSRAYNTEIPGSRIPEPWMIFVRYLKLVFK